MTFRIREGKGFGDEGMTFTAPIIARKLNGYVVEGQSKDSTAFLQFEDIEILHLTEQEKALEVEL